MAKFDKDYLELVNRILDDGIKVKNSYEMDRMQILHHSFTFALGREFPILQTNQVFYEDAIMEMLWIWQMQSNDVRELHKRGIYAWDEWMIDEDGIYRVYEDDEDCEYDPDKEVVVIDPLSVPTSVSFGYHHGFKPKYDENGKVMTAKSIIPGKNIKSAKYFGREYANTIGTAGGYITKKYQMTQDVEYILKNVPTVKSIVNNLHQNEFLRTAVIQPSVYGLEWSVTGDKLNLFVHQSGCDVVSDLPNNVVQYATMLKMMAQVTGLEADIMTYSINDAYVNISQIDGLKEQIKRWNKYCYLREMSTYQLLNKQLYIENLITLNKDGKTTIESEKLKELDLEYNMIDMILNPKTCEMWLNPEINGFFGFDSSKELKDIELKKYKHMGKIKGLSLDKRDL